MPTVQRARFPLFSKVFSDSWRSLLAWSLGLVAAASLYLPIYPSMGGSAQMQDLIDTLPKELVRSLNYDQIGTGPGYAQATIFGLIAYLLLGIAVISWGAAALGGDEESGQLELTLAHAVTRVQVAVARFAALAVKVLALSLFLGALVLFWNSPAQLDIDAVNLLGTCLLFAGLILLSGTAALLCGAVGGRRVWGVGGGAFVAVLGYVLNALGNQSADLEWLHALSPYNWVFGHNPLSNGADWATVGLLFAASVVLAVATALVVRQRDVGV
ncbi:ABC transporter permease [Cryobacterium roopkundense]|uniref:ABC transporter permease n=1 Tax=Cryobacterium roopkundense TaxID=1001240 RepID=A0A099J3M1_9MICO|nr:ABC transporter permease [Cryobacterium roopkundense]